MKTLYLKIIIISIFCFLLPCGRLSAQANLQIKLADEVNFSKLSDQDQRLWLQTTMNESNVIILSKEFQEMAKMYYTEAGIDERVKMKYFSVIKVLFNESIAIQNRIALVSYLLVNFSKEEIPHNLLNEIKFQLQTQSVK
ncbi:MAG: hypothetical protein IPI46_06320 [Bacteroidetes bacterium]|nr:hypothetical protein [Bacteroidota bacterium]